MKKKWMGMAWLPFLLLAAGASAQEKPEPPKTRKALTPLKVQLVFVKYQGEKKISSLPYTLSVNADDQRSTRLRMGIEVPLVIKDNQVQYRNVGTNIDCRAEAMEDGRFNLNLSVEQSSIYSAEGERKSASWAVGDAPISSQPLFRSFNSTFNPVLRDGQSAQYTAATDPVSGEVVKVEVTLNVVK